MVALHESEEPVDLHTLSDHLIRHKRLDAVGGPVALAEIADYEATAANVLHHSRIVRDKSLKRGLIEAGSEIVSLAFEQEGRADELLDAAESKIFELSRSKGRHNFRSLGDEMLPTLDHIEDVKARGGGLTGIPSGLTDLDKLTGGLQAGELIVLAARPSMGKTALALNIARNAAVDFGKRVAFFSLEMTARALILRLLSAEARVDLRALRLGLLADSRGRQLADAANRLSQAGIWIDDSGEATILEVKAKCRRLKAEEGLDLVFLDYLQLVNAGHARRDRKDLEIAEVSKGLKALAKELDIPVVALSQLNRGPEQRDPDKRRPILGDLRESGAIEQDADVIGFIYRDIVYNRDADPRLAELDIAKQRNGPTDTVRLHFDGGFSRFENLSEREEAGAPGFGGGRFVAPDDEAPF
jgi:replicative DNA helicase